MKYLLTISSLFMVFQFFAQMKPQDKGFEAFRVLTKNDTIDFYIYNPKKTPKKHLLVHIDGSYPAPLWIETNPCCVSLDPFNYKLIPEEYAYVVISKHGFPFSDKEYFEIPAHFWKKNTLDFRVERVDQVIKYIQKQVFNPEKIVVIGTSQGTDVAAKLATVNKDITHLGFWAGGGLTQMMEFVLFIRKEAISGKITEEEAARKIDTLLNQFREMVKDPSPDKMWEGNSYLSYVSFSEPPVQNLLQVDIPIFVAVGTKDENVAVENSYVIPLEFIRNHKTNLTFKHYPNYDHGFIEKMANGDEIDRFDKVTLDFLNWLNENPVKLTK